jgi:hypothetical protein
MLLISAKENIWRYATDRELIRITYTPRWSTNTFRGQNRSRMIASQFLTYKETIVTIGFCQRNRYLMTKNFGLTLTLRKPSH